MEKSITKKQKQFFLSFVGALFWIHAMSAGVLSDFPVCSKDPAVEPGTGETFPKVLARWDFASETLVMENGRIKVKDTSGKGFVGEIRNSARIRTIGNGINGTVNVLDLGDGSGYFDMGQEIGEGIYQLREYTMCAYFRIDETYTGLNNAGNFLWNFSNSADVMADKNGYIISSLKDQSHSVAPTYYSNNQNVNYARNATKGNWHHIAFTQDGITGTLYIDGVQVARNTSMTYLPATALPVSGRTGTLYNWLGRSCYADDVYLGKTLIYDFSIFDAAIRAEDLKNGFAGFSPVGETLGQLDKAYAENPEFISKELQKESENLSLDGIDGLTGTIKLPVAGSLDKSVTLSWASSHPALISSEGEVNRPECVDAHVTLTARLMKDGQSLTRTFLVTVKSKILSHHEKTRVIVTTDGEDDDKASMVRFLLTTNEFDVEGIINSSSQFHWVGGKGWNAFKPVSWIEEYINLYAQVYGNLVQHDRNYPSPDFLLSKWAVGNINGVGEDNIRTKGAELIVKVLLDDSDPRPVWIQAWGGCNTISRALKIIQEDYPERMEEAAAKMRLYLIWEQDETYQKYIRPNWEQYNIPTIISDQFDCIAYIWPKVLPSEVKKYFEANWMNEHILKERGALCKVYVNNNGAYNAEGDTPAFLHCIPNGLRSLESPGNGGWGGRYVKVRNNVWMDPPPATGYTHPAGQWGFSNSWSKMMENYTAPGQVAIRTNYFKPIWRWLGEVQADFAARADWCVKEYASANHHPVVRLKDTPFDIEAQAGSKVVLDASPTTDPDGDELTFRWWHYSEAGTYAGETIAGSDRAIAAITIPEDARPGETIHIICEVSDSGTPSLTRYQRVVITVAEGGTGFKNTAVSQYSVVSVNGGIKIDGLCGDERVGVFDISGRTVNVKNLKNIRLQNGVYVVKINSDSIKVVVG